MAWMYRSDALKVETMDGQNLKIKGNAKVT